jgi:hypothetical protein
MVGVVAIPTRILPVGLDEKDRMRRRTFRIWHVEH